MHIKSPARHDCLDWPLSSITSNTGRSTTRRLTPDFQQFYSLRHFVDISGRRVEERKKNSSICKTYGTNQTGSVSKQTCKSYSARLQQIADNMASAENVVLLVCLCVGLVSTVDSFCPSKFSILETNVINLREKSIQTPR